MGLYQWVKQQLKADVVAYNQDLETGILLERFCTGYLPLCEKKVSVVELNNLNQAIKRRVQGEPLAYVVGYQEFYGLSFIVDKRVLVPRPETELMVDYLLENRPIKGAQIIDIGTGSGALVCTLAKHLGRNYQFWALDKSQEALVVARQNVQSLVADQVVIICSDLLVDLPLVVDQEYVFVANLPYVTLTEYQELAPVVRDFEPREALVAADQGLALYYRLIVQIRQSGVKKFTLLCEISPWQVVLLKAFITQNLPTSSLIVLTDYSARERVVVVKN